MQEADVSYAMYVLHVCLVYTQSLRTPYVYVYLRVSQLYYGHALYVCSICKHCMYAVYVGSTYIRGLTCSVLDRYVASHAAFLTVTGSHQQQYS